MGFRLFERLYLVVLLLSSMGVVDALTRPPQAGNWDIATNQVPLLTAVVQAALFAIGGLLVLCRWRGVVRAMPLIWPLLLLSALAPLSMAWSILPVLTLRKSVLVLGSTFIGIYIGERYSIEHLARLLAISIGIMLVAIVVVFAVSPARIVQPGYSYLAWRGLSGTKNTFGGYMAISVAVLSLVRFRRFGWLRYALLAGAAACLALSHSATALVTCVLLLAAVPLWRFSRVPAKQRLFLYAALPVAFLGVSYIAASHAQDILHLVGRSSSLTGRVPLWSAVTGAIAKHPILGYGYGSFWDISNIEAERIWTQVRWLAMASHNGYLDTCLSFGFTGLAVLIFVLVNSFRSAYGYLRQHRGSIALWPMTFIMYFLLHNLLESHLMTTRSLDYLLFVAITTALALDRRSRSAMEVEYAGETTFDDTPVRRLSPVALANGRNSIVES